MLKRSPLIIISLMLASAFAATAQDANNNNAPQTRRRTTTTTTTGTSRTGSTRAAQGSAASSQDSQPPQQTQPPTGSTQTRTRQSPRTQGRAGTDNRAAAQDPTARGVLAAFESLLEGIRRASVNDVTGAYWNSPQLVLFNYNGTVTRGWQQLRENRAASYPNMKDVKLDVRDLRVQMLGQSGALVTCLWTQSQTYKGTPETATGRMTIVFRRTGNAWKAIHLHTSPDTPEPTRLPPSEQTSPQTTRPGATPRPR